MKTYVLTSLSKERLQCQTVNGDPWSLTWGGREVVLSQYLYQISFDGNGSKSGTMESITCGGGETIKLPSCSLKRNGYVFAGWNTEKEGSGRAIKDGASVKNLGKTEKEEVVLYAQWKKETKTYQIKFMPNHKLAKGKMKAVTYTYGKKKKLPANQYNVKGYTFAGWNTKKDGSGKGYRNKQEIKNLSSQSGGTVTLYAQWKAKKKGKNQ